MHFKTTGFSKRTFTSPRPSKAYLSNNSTARKAGSRENPSLSRTGQPLPASGLTISGMVSATRCGLMDLAMKVPGEMTKLTAKENYPMPMETFMKESGATTKLTEKELTLMPTALTIMGTG